MRPESEYRRALELIRLGVNDCEIGRRLGIPRGTIRDWRVGLEIESGGRTKDWTSRRSASCFRCDGGYVDEQAYAYLLGMYLGDGCLSLHRRGVYRLRIACDLKYPDIIDEVATHIVSPPMRWRVSTSTGPWHRSATSRWLVVRTLPFRTPLSDPRAGPYNVRSAGVAKLAKAMVSNTIGGNPLWVRIPPPAPTT